MLFIANRLIHRRRKHRAIAGEHWNPWYIFLLEGDDIYALLAFIPILFCVVVMAVFNWPAKFAMPISWLITAVLGFFVWNMDVLQLIAYTIAGLFNSIEVLIIIFGALIALVIVVLAAKFKFLTPKKVWHFGPESQWEEGWKASHPPAPPKESKMSLIKAWIPYVIIAFIPVSSLWC